MNKILEKRGFICDMDGVLYHGEELLPGVREFVSWLTNSEKQFLFLTNSSRHTPKELQKKLERMGMHVEEKHFYTSALATADFIYSQAKGCKVYAVGDSGLHTALHEKGIKVVEDNPDYVIIGETESYNYEKILKAVKFVNNGAKLIGTNYDLTGPAEDGLIPACRSLMAPIELSTGKTAYYVGKPNPLMMRTGLRMLGVHTDEAVIIGDRMDTDIIAGIESGLDTVLVLSGVTDIAESQHFPYRPRVILEGVNEFMDFVNNQ